MVLRVMHLFDLKKLFICFEKIFEVFKPHGNFLVFIFLLGGVSLHIRDVDSPQSHSPTVTPFTGC